MPLLLPPKPRVRESFERAAASYDDAAVLQRQVCERLLANFLPDLEPGEIIDAGCGTGYGCRLLRARWPSVHLTAVDFATTMLAVARNDADACLVADIEALPCISGGFSAWWSNLTVQWCDTDQVLAEARRVLRPGGHLALSTLGPETFRELGEAFNGIDRHRHTLSFSEPAAVADALAHAGFTDIRLHRQVIELHYPDLKTLLRAIKEIGANSVGEGARAGLLGRGAWQRVQAAYEQHRTPAGLPARYDVILAYARK
ncbi:malonyl-ACP O-methyltransferase BioC [Accumulibacter sp.]|uniref:malonyl-ACP O-methyltransferase BioC n=1 Tax=Accumulibacter sp. TaxID=2053492 RepID=UPI001D33DAB4|nr:malonyl-ACP O-methyltransferase BioC [Accumulibacter sp.]MCB1932648.1 malonyl-ACP O-methyltransferase BioC [Accumulibacter sp.]MCB1967827.1 malonyl-ACP O-methyltransferase BioC [Accumulibacter sp.]MCP5229006.1 malonyl-ACP O-methyltransferase BioC [Accumulibacter sp.]